MPNHDLLIKGEAVIKDEWITYSEESLENLDQTKKNLIPYSLFPLSDDVNKDSIGVLLPNDIEIEKVASEIIDLPLIAVDFPVFMDGRGFSFARILKSRFNYQGELRATGHIIRDQLCYLKRCGFNSFKILDEDVDLEAATQSLHDFSDAYQTSADDNKPVYLRRMQ